ncbi:MAG: hypothetical protein U0165_08340 [Polyangiaceae bacterium]
MKRSDSRSSGAVGARRFAARMTTLSALWLVTLSSSFAAAQPANSPTAADRETARALMGEGDTKFEAKDYAGALSAYEGAHKIMGVPTTGIAVARALEALGQLIEARDLALQVARIPTSSGEPKPFAQARSDADSLAEKLAAKIATVKIEVSGLPAGTTPKVTIDGVALTPEAAALPRKVNPGKRVIAASAPGFANATQEVVLKPGATVDVKLAMIASSATDKPTKGGSEPARPAAEDSNASKGKKEDSRAIYFRGALGLGYFLTSEKVTGSTTLPDVKGTFSKAAIGLDLALGYHVAKGYAVGGEVRLVSMSNPNATVGGVDVKTSGSVTNFFIGPFVDWFPNQGGGLHLGGALGIATLSHSNTSRGPKSQGGFGAVIGGGYDFYLAPGWAVGPVLDASLLATSAKTSDASKETGSAVGVSVVLGARVLYF